jgi:hypothetical protein
MDDPIAVALEGRAQPARLLFTRAPSRLVGADCERRQPQFLVLAYAKLEGIGDPAGKLGHAGKASSSSGAGDGRGGPIPSPHPPGGLDRRSRR